MVVDAYPQESQLDASVLVSPAEGFDTYGELSIHAVGQQHPSFGVTIENEGHDEQWDTLGTKFRSCEVWMRSFPSSLHPRCRRRPRYLPS